MEESLPQSAEEEDEDIKIQDGSFDIVSAVAVEDTIRRRGNVINDRRSTFIIADNADALSASFSAKKFIAASISDGMREQVTAVTVMNMVRRSILRWFDFCMLSTWRC